MGDGHFQPRKMVPKPLPVEAMYMGTGNMAAVISWMEQRGKRMAPANMHRHGYSGPPHWHVWDAGSTWDEDDGGLCISVGHWLGFNTVTKHVVDCGPEEKSFEILFDEVI